MGVLPPTRDFKGRTYSCRVGTKVRGVGAEGLDLDLTGVEDPVRRRVGGEVGRVWVECRSFRVTRGRGQGGHGSKVDHL